MISHNHLCRHCDMSWNCRKVPTHVRDTDCDSYEVKKHGCVQQKAYTKRMMGMMFSDMKCQYNCSSPW
jgi:hypothetical protein